MPATPEKRTIRVALLINDTPVPSVVQQHGDYLQIYTTHLQDSLASYPDHKLKDTVGELIVDGYDVVKGEYPAEDRLVRGAGEGWRYDAVMMTGSASSAYQPLPWILRLVDFIRDLVTDENKRAVKVIGICFGMQILALALGSDVAPNPAGWELGIYDVDLTDCGRDWLARVVGHQEGEKWDGKVLAEGREVEAVDVEELVRKEQEVLSIQQVHRDHVTSLPKDTQLVGSTPKCAVQGFIRYYPSTSSSRRPIHILALEGHPEFIPDIVNKIIDARAAKGVLDEPTTREARERAGRKMRGGRGVVSGGGKEGADGLEGRGVVGWAVMQVLLE